ncbi:hypothetical protein Salat_1605900 [Sesamum alatum]|uniref:Uncharacterized protein n=1 Tax=Sesamum alatum TaxID=300844 RepID=A0AAE1Y5T5_9LAMI|nr:hypothetical protein Salat_1605900 [Sesamum alatum]
MGFVLMKKRSLLFLLLSAAIFSTSFAGTTTTAFLILPINNYPNPVKNGSGQKAQNISRMFFTQRFHAVRLSKSLENYPELKEIAISTNDFESRDNNDLEVWKQQGHDDEEEEMNGEMIHERVLRVETNDYGRYDPAPTLVKPRFKLIPN